MIYDFGTGGKAFVWASGIEQSHPNRPSSVHIFLHFPEEMPLFVYIENTFSDIETIRTRRYSPLIITYFFDLWPQFIECVHRFMVSFNA